MSVVKSEDENNLCLNYFGTSLTDTVPRIASLMVEGALHVCRIREVVPRQTRSVLGSSRPGTSVFRTVSGDGLVLSMKDSVKLMNRVGSFVLSDSPFVNKGFCRAIMNHFYDKSLSSLLLSRSDRDGVGRDRGAMCYLLRKSFFVGRPVPFDF